MAGATNNGEGMHVGGERGEHSQAGERPPEPCADEVQEELARVVADPGFSVSARDRNFLRYVVSEALAGRADRIKAFSIATEVFGRDHNFDAQNDPVVRVEAGRLRRALEHYYLVAGRDNPIVISMPKGAYKPTFTRRAPTHSGTAASGDGSAPSHGGHVRSVQATSHLSIVVLPFANLSPDPEQDYFADAIVADLTTDLSRIAGRPVDAKEIGRELGVGFMIGGSVRRERESVRVNVELVDTLTGGEVWAHRFQGNSENLFALQDSITSNIAATLNAKLVMAAARHVDVLANPSALDLVLRGRAAASRARTRDTLSEAQQFYEQALRLEPENTDAKIGLAEALVGLGLSLLSVNKESDLRRADELVSAALLGQPNSAWAHYVKGEILRCNRRTSEAASEYQAAISLNPNYAAAIGNLGYSRILVGKLGEGVLLLERAISISPRDPMRAIWHSRIGQASLYLENFEAAKTALEKSRTLNPNLPWNHFYLAGTYALQGNVQEAMAALAQGQKLFPDIRSIRDYKALSQVSHPELEVLRDKTLVVGLRRAGLSDVAANPSDPPLTT